MGARARVDRSAGIGGVAGLVGVIPAPPEMEEIPAQIFDFVGSKATDADQPTIRHSFRSAVPPDDAQVVQSLLRGDADFLLFSPSAYNTVGLGTTQLYNRTLVYNRKRHGIFKLGKREFDF